MNLKKIGVVHGRWFMGWSMEGVQGVVHGRGPRGGPWTGVSVFNSPLRILLVGSRFSICWHGFKILAKYLTINFGNRVK